MEQPMNASGGNVAIYCHGASNSVQQCSAMTIDLVTLDLLDLRCEQLIFGGRGVGCGGIYGIPAGELSPNPHVCILDFF